MSDALVREFAPAKINLFLHVGDRRPDGFHELQSLVAFASVGDALSLERADDLSLEIDGPFAGDLASDSTNLVRRAARALEETAGTKCPAKIVLTKNLPLASGIGGGSSDAAATLRGLERLWQIEMAEQIRLKIASGLGSDVPVCLAPKSSWMEGRGERVTPAPSMPSLAILLVHPGVAVQTQNVFARLDKRSGIGGAKDMKWSSAAELTSFLKTTANDLEEPARSIAPVIGDALRALSTCSGIQLARMSGSGATCFGLFESKSAAAIAARRISDEHQDWWVASARLL